MKIIIIKLSMLYERENARNPRRKTKPKLWTWLKPQFILEANGLSLKKMGLCKLKEPTLYQVNQENAYQSITW